MPKGPFSHNPEMEEAIRRFKAGAPPQFSTGIDGSKTAGYGRLDDNGFWQFPLPPAYWPVRTEAPQPDSPPAEPCCLEPAGTHADFCPVGEPAPTAEPPKPRSKTNTRLAGLKAAHDLIFQEIRRFQAGQEEAKTIWTILERVGALVVEERALRRRQRKA